MSLKQFVFPLLGMVATVSVGAHADEGPTWLNGFWRGRGAVIRDGGMGQCSYVFTEFRISENSYLNTAFKRKCLSPTGQSKVDGGQTVTKDDIVIENLPAVAVTAKDGKLMTGETQVGTYTDKDVEVSYRIPFYNEPPNTFTWHGRFSLVNGSLVFQEDAATYGPDGKLIRKDIVYGGVMEPVQGDTEKLTEELTDPN